MRTVKTWREGASNHLQDCYNRTYWDIFLHKDLEDYTAAVLSYIKYCTDTVTVDNMKERNIAFKSGDAAQYSATRANLRRCIREAKVACKIIIENHIKGCYF